MVTDQLQKAMRVKLAHLIFLKLKKKSKLITIIIITTMPVQFYFKQYKSIYLWHASWLTKSHCSTLLYFVSYFFFLV